ncbi:MAG: HAD family hydrolase [Dehalococcoidia bacterium]
MKKGDWVKAVFFDMGGTVEDLKYDEELRLAAAGRLLRLLKQHGLDPGLPKENFYQLVSSGLRRYMEWRVQSKVEIKAADFWNEYVFGDLNLPSQKIARIAELLTFFVETNFYRRQMRKEVPRVLEAIRQMGLKIGCISNVLGIMLVPYCLEKYGIINYFEVIVLSSIYGRRKPDPSIFRYAARLTGVSPAQCVYVGDTISRDVIGSKQAGYGLSLLIPSSLTQQSDISNEPIQPDATLDNLEDVVEILGLK